MKMIEFDSQVWLPQERDKVFPFFADASNLEEITPEWLRFRVISPMPIEVCTGTEIDYCLKLHGIPIRWRSRITVWDPPHRFVDEQVIGPFRQWVHEHRFTERAGGTQCADHLEYAIFGGVVVNKLLVARDIKKIFAYRSIRLQEVFQNVPTEECGKIAAMKIQPATKPSGQIQTTQHQKRNVL